MYAIEIDIAKGYTGWKTYCTRRLLLALFAIELLTINLKLTRRRVPRRTLMNFIPKSTCGCRRSMAVIVLSS